MNNKYSLFSKIIHRQFLSKNELTNFFIERINEKSSKLDIDLSNNIFITGLARSGTTALLQAFDSTEIFASLRYKYMPFILSPRLAKIYTSYFNSKDINESERIHGDGLKISPNAAECLDEPFWIKTIYDVNKFDKQLIPHNLNEKELKGYSYLLRSFTNIENKKRMIIKNNNNHLRLSSLSKFFPNSKFLILFRSPLGHSLSLLNLHKKLKKIQSKDKFVLEYMNLIGHWEFGLNKKPFIYKDYQYKYLLDYDDNSINYWLNQWLYSYEWILKELLDINSKNIILICYEDLCEDLNYQNNLLKKLKIKKSTFQYKFKLGLSNNKNNPKDINNRLLIQANNFYSELKNKSKNDLI